MAKYIAIMAFHVSVLQNFNSFQLAERFLYHRVLAYLIGSVAGLGCLSGIAMEKFPDPGSKRFRIPNPNPHQRIQVFLALKIVSKL